MTRRERISLRFDADIDSIDGKLFSYLKQNPAIPLREAIARALRAYYLLWALEDERSLDDLKSLAKTLQEDLQLRAFQIQQRFVGEPTWALLPSQASPATSVVTLPMQAHRAGETQPTPSLPQEPPLKTVTDLRKDLEDVDLDDLEFAPPQEGSPEEN